MARRPHGGKRHHDEQDEGGRAPRAYGLSQRQRERHAELATIRRRRTPTAGASVTAVAQHTSKAVEDAANESWLDGHMSRDLSPRRAGFEPRPATRTPPHHTVIVTVTGKVPILAISEHGGDRSITRL